METNGARLLILTRGLAILLALRVRQLANLLRCFHPDYQGREPDCALGAELGQPDEQGAPPLHARPRVRVERRPARQLARYHRIPGRNVCVTGAQIFDCARFVQAFVCLHGLEVTPAAVFSEEMLRLIGGAHRSESARTAPTTAVEATRDRFSPTAARRHLD
jgi:hypothetical protein